jgi:hypothetical protein
LSRPVQKYSATGDHSGNRICCGPNCSCRPIRVYCCPTRIPNSSTGLISTYESSTYGGLLASSRLVQNRIQSLKKLPAKIGRSTKNARRSRKSPSW